MGLGVVASLLPNADGSPAPLLGSCSHPEVGVPCSYWAGVEVLAPVVSTNTVGWRNLLPARGDGGPAPYLAFSDTALRGVFPLRLC